MKKLKKDYPLTVEIKDGQLKISVGIDTLAYSAEHSEYANPFDEKLYDYKQIFKITDPLQFAKDVKLILEREEEDGSTPLNLFLDKICESTFDDGSEGVEYEEN
jgi:hypothetical protein